MPYATGTEVPVEKSQGEIRALLAKHGATHYAYGSGPDGDVIQFRLADRHYRFNVDAPSEDALRDAYITERVKGGEHKYRAERLANNINWRTRWNAEWKRRWRARLLWLKALLEFTDDVPLQEAMLANLVLPDGSTFGRWAEPQIDAMYASGGMPPMLGDGRH